MEELVIALRTELRAEAKRAVEELIKPLEMFSELPPVSTTQELAKPGQADEITSVRNPLLSEAEAARFLGISKMTLLRRRNAGNISFFRVGFRVLYSREKHLLPFLEQCEVKK